MRASQATLDASKSEVVPRVHLATCSTPLEWKSTGELEGDSSSGRSGAGLCATLTSARLLRWSRWSLGQFPVTERVGAIELNCNAELAWLNSTRALSVDWASVPAGGVTLRESWPRLERDWEGAGEAESVVTSRGKPWSSQVPVCASSLTPPDLERSETLEAARAGAAGVERRGDGVSSTSRSQKSDELVNSGLELAEEPALDETGPVWALEHRIQSSPTATEPCMNIEMSVIDEQETLFDDPEPCKESVSISTSFIEENASDAAETLPLASGESRSEAVASKQCLRAGLVSQSNWPGAADSRLDVALVKQGQGRNFDLTLVSKSKEAAAADLRATHGLGAMSTTRAPPRRLAFSDLDKSQTSSPQEIARKTARDAAIGPAIRIGVGHPDASALDGQEANLKPMTTISQPKESSEQNHGLAVTSRLPLLLEPTELASRIEQVVAEASKQCHSPISPVEPKTHASHLPLTSLSLSHAAAPALHSENPSLINTSSTKRGQRTCWHLLLLDVRPPMSYEFEHLHDAEQLWAGRGAHPGDDNDRLKALVQAACERISLVNENLDLVIYDHCSESLEKPQPMAVKLACALCVELPRRDAPAHRVWLLKGGFARMARAYPQHVVRLKDGSTGTNLCAQMRARAGPLFERLLHRFLHERTQPATLILPYLYVGSERDAADWCFLQEARITHVLIVGSELKPHFPGAFCYEHIPVLDSVDEHLDCVYSSIFAFIDESRRNPDSVILAHCYAGTSRSVSAVLAYLVYSGWTLAAAWELVRERRSVSRPNAGFWRQLMSYEWQRHGVQTLLQPPSPSPLQ